jgi:hypothetical protein
MQEEEWDLPHKKISYSALLDSLLDVRNAGIKKTEPVFRQYALLKTYLRKYRDIDAAGGWPLLVADKNNLSQRGQRLRRKGHPKTPAALRRPCIHGHVCTI